MCRLNTVRWHGSLLQACNPAAWRNIDAELAQLTYDSDIDERMVAATRSETASIRALTFTSARLSLELEVTENSLLGQISPARTGTIEVHTTAGTTTTTVDEIDSPWIPSRMAHSGCATAPRTAPT